MRRTAIQPMNGDVRLETWFQRQPALVAKKTGSRWPVGAFLKQRRYSSTPEKTRLWHRFNFQEKEAQSKIARTDHEF